MAPKVKANGGKLSILPQISNCRSSLLSRTMGTPFPFLLRSAPPAVISQNSSVVFQISTYKKLMVPTHSNLTQRSSEQLTTVVRVEGRRSFTAKLFVLTRI